MGQGSETGDDGIDHGVLLINQRHPAPFVKSGARMRNTQTHQIAHLKHVARRIKAVQIGVLII
jgi:hypothetical protein